MSLPRSSKRKASTAQGAQKGSKRVRVTSGASKSVATDINDDEVIAGANVQPSHETIIAPQSSSSPTSTAPTPASRLPIQPSVSKGAITGAVATPDALTWGAVTDSGDGPVTLNHKIILASERETAVTIPTQATSSSKPSKAVKRPVRGLPSAERRSSQRLVEKAEKKAELSPSGSSATASKTPAIAEEPSTPTVTALSTSITVNTTANDRRTGLDSDNATTAAVPNVEEQRVEQNGVNAAQGKSTTNHTCDEEETDNDECTDTETDDESDVDTIAPHSSFLPLSSARDEPLPGSTWTDLVDAAASCRSELAHTLSWDAMQQAVGRVTARDTFLKAIALESAALTQAASFDALLKAVEIVTAEAPAAQDEVEAAAVASAVAEEPLDSTPAPEAEESFNEAEVSIILLEDDE